MRMRMRMRVEKEDEDENEGEGEGEDQQQHQRPRHRPEEQAGRSSARVVRCKVVNSSCSVLTMPRPVLCCSGQRPHLYLVRLSTDWKMLIPCRDVDPCLPTLAPRAQLFSPRLSKKGGW
eukprot:3216758-Rhodomonas_salina.1